MRRRFLQHLSLLALINPAPALAKTVRLVDNRLLGKWRSDRTLTMQYWHFEPDATPEVREQLAAMFGRVTWKFTETEFTFELEHSRFSVPYQVLAKDAISVAVSLGGQGTGTLQYIRFENDYLYTLTGSHNLEFFSRVLA
jgi:hypothetical protein